MILEDITKHDIEQIKRECSEFIKHNDQPLYRGMWPRGEIIKKEIRTDRKPRDSSNFSTVLYNLIVEEKKNIKNLRNRVAYASTDEEQASQYGEIYMILPVNNTKLVYDSNTKDSVNTTSNLEDLFYGIFKQQVEKIGISVDTLDHKFVLEHQISPFLDEKQFESELVSHFRKLFKSKKQTSDVMNNVIKEFVSTAEKSVIGSLHIHTTDKAIKKISKTFEVGMFDAKHYYAISGSGLWKSQLDSTDKKKSWLDVFKIKNNSELTPIQWYQQVLRQ